jgi:hypothetical protein
LERKVKAGKSKPKLKDIDSNISSAAWSILRWYDLSPLYIYIYRFVNLHLRCVASCTAHIEAITSGEELIKDLGRI